MLLLGSKVGNTVILLLKYRYNFFHGIALSNLNPCCNLWSYLKLANYLTTMSKKRQLEDKTGTNVSKKATNANRHWALGLLKAMEDPNQIVAENKNVVVIKDKYPKAKYHYLVIPKESISGLKDLTQENCKLLSCMYKEANEVAKKHPDHEFKIGYHAEASMVQLHLHIVSCDFDSPGLKTKKHWNSYNTEFFLPHSDVYEQLKSEGQVTLKSSAECKLLLSKDLKCHKCEFGSNTIPKLKEHLFKVHGKVIKNSVVKFDE